MPMAKFIVDVELMDGIKLSAKNVPFTGQPFELVRVVQALFPNWKTVQAWNDSGATTVLRAKTAVKAKRKTKRKKKTAKKKLAKDLAAAKALADILPKPEVLP